MLGLTVDCFDVLFQRKLILQLGTTSRANPSIQLADASFVLDSDEVAEKCPIAKLSALERPYAIVFVHVKFQPAQLLESGVANRTSVVICLLRADTAFHVHSMGHFAVEFSTAFFARQDRRIVIVISQQCHS